MCKQMGHDNLPCDCDSRFESATDVVGKITFGTTTSYCQRCNRLPCCCNTPDPIKFPAPEGIKFDTERIRMELITPEFMEEVGKVLTHGAKKYSPRNWEKGISYSRIIAAMLRHLYAFMRGERIDPESGLLHTAHLACNALFLLTYDKRGMTKWNDIQPIAEAEKE